MLLCLLNDMWGKINLADDTEKIFLKLKIICQKSYQLPHMLLYILCNFFGGQIIGIAAKRVFNFFAN